MHGQICKFFGIGLIKIYLIGKKVLNHSTLMSRGRDEVRLTTFRVNTTNQERIEIKRIFKHPLYRLNVAYNDIALAELGRRQRRRKKREEKTKVFVAAVWGKEFIQFLAELAVLHETN